MLLQYNIWLILLNVHCNTQYDVRFIKHVMRLALMLDDIALTTLSLFTVHKHILKFVMKWYCTKNIIK